MNHSLAFLANLALMAFISSVTSGFAVEPYLVAVSNERDGSVTLIDGPTHSIVASIRVGKRPRGIHSSPDGQTLYVAVSGTPVAGAPLKRADQDNSPEIGDPSEDGIAVVDVAKRTRIATLPAGSDPEQFAVSRDGERLYIANKDIGMLSVLHLPGGTIEGTVKVRGKPDGVKLSPDSTQVYVTCATGGDICVIDTRNLQIISEFVVPGRPRDVTFSLDGDRAFIASETGGTIHVIDTAVHAEVSAIPLPDGSMPVNLIMSPEGDRLYVSTGRGATVCVVDPETQSVVKIIPVGLRAQGMSLSPDGSRLYVANGSSNDISVVDTAEGTEMARVVSGASPWGTAIIRGP